MRGAGPRKPSNLTIILMALLAMGVVFEHAVSASINQLVGEALLTVAVIVMIGLLLRYVGKARGVI